MNIMPKQSWGKGVPQVTLRTGQFYALAVSAFAAFIVVAYCNATNVNELRTIVAEHEETIAELRDVIAVKNVHLEDWADKYNKLHREAELMEDQLTRWETSGATP